MQLIGHLSKLSLHRETARAGASARNDVSAAALTSGGNITPALSFNTASITPTANKVLIVAVASGHSAPSPSPSVSGCGITWDLITENYVLLSGQLLSVFRGTAASPSAGALTISFPSVAYCMWSVVELTNAREGNNAADSIGVIGAATNLSGVNTAAVSIPGFSDHKNATYVAIHNRKNENITPKAGFTELHDTGLTNRRLETQFKASPDENPSGTWATNDFYSIVAFEIKAK